MAMYQWLIGFQGQEETFLHLRGMTMTSLILDIAGVEAEGLVTEQG